MATAPHRPDRIHNARRFARFLGEEVLGGLCLLTGFVLTFTLVLLPIGVPLALVGVALMISALDSD